MNFGQLLTAMVTPFDRNGQIDFEQTSKLVYHLMDHGTDGLVVAGTTGESPTLTQNEKLSLFRHVVKIVNGKVPVIAGTGSNDTKAAVEFTKKVEDVGVDAVMVVAPYYNKPNQKGLYHHFKAVADATTLPVMIYNIPGRSVVNITADTIVELSKIDNIVSVKEASGDLDQMSMIIKNTGADFSLYSGDDGLTLPVLSIGGQGVISVASHIIGNEMKEMIQHFQNGSVPEAADFHRKLLPVMRELFRAPNPAPVKAALKYDGIDTGNVQLPLVPLTAEEHNSLIHCLKNVRLDIKS